MKNKKFEPDALFVGPNFYANLGHKKNIAWFFGGVEEKTRRN